jgi:hypothetical protein
MNDFDRWLVANGFDPNTVSDSQRAILKASFEASKAPATPPPATPPAPAPQLELDAIIATRRADQQRRTEIAALYEKYTENRPDFVAEAEKICKLANSGGMTASETELQLLRASRVNVDVRGWVGHNGDNGQINAPVMEASLLRSMGWDRAKLEKRFPVPVLEAADRQYRHGLELSETFLTFARKNGHRGYTLNASNLESVLKAAFHEDIRADGPSTISLPGILSNVSNLSIQDHFNSVDAAWREIAAIGTVNDFKEMTSYSLTGDLTYDQIAPGGEIKHGKLDETEYGNKADSYGKMLSVDRRDLINDNLGAFNAINRKLGRGGALKLNLVFWTELLDNTDFFKTANANYDAGTDSAFDSDGLESADNIFRNQTDPDGNPLGALAKILLVPTGLRIPALRLMTSQKVMEDSTAGDSNPWANMFRVVSSPYLTNANIPGYSTVKWYLFADPNDLPVIQVVFLNGVQLPTVETVQMDINRLGITHRAVFDFGVRKQEYRGGVAMKGEN